MLRFGIVGTNFISDNFIDAVSTLPNVTVTAVASRNEATARCFAKRHSIPFSFENYDDFLASPNIDAVYIATPIGCHPEQTLKALRKGKHVLCEKAISPSASLLDEMCAASEETGTVLMEAMRPIHTPTFQFLRSHLKELGTIRFVQFDFCQYSSRYDAFKHGEILNAFNPDLCNAAVLDIGIYPISCMLYLFGNPTAISAHSVLLDNGFEGRGSAVFSYPEMTSVINYSKLENSAGPSAIVGEKGFFAINKLTSPRTVTFTPNGGNTKTVFEDMTENNMCYEIADFCAAVEGRLDPLPFLSLSRSAIRITDEIRKRNSVRLPCDK